MAQPEQVRQEWVKPADLARQEGVRRQTVWDWVRKGALEVKRLGPGTAVRVRVPPPPPRAPK